MSVLFHIGYPKTATTFLQREVFPQIDGARYVPFREPAVSELVRALAGRATAPAPLDHHRRVLEDLEGDDERPLLLSHESILGMAWRAGLDADQAARRLREVAPEACILLVFRRQEDVLISLYRQYVQVGGRARPETFFAGDDLGDGRLQREHLFYDQMIERYEGLFGRVVALPYEWLRREPERFFTGLSEWVGSPVPPITSDRARNQSLSWPLTALLRRWNGAVRRTEMNPDPPAARRRWVPDRLLDLNPRPVLQGRVDPVIRALLRGDGRAPVLPDGLLRCYARSNARLADRTGFDLAGLDYVLEPLGVADA